MKKPRFGHIEAPLQRVHVELTNVCQFDCAFCPKEAMTRRPGHMETGLAKRVLTELAEGGVCEKVTFHVMGEPTLHRDFFDILDHAAAAGLKVGLTTNGAGLGGRVGGRLLGYGLHQVDVSLQTPDARSFRLRRAGQMGFDEYANGVMGFFRDYRARWPQAAFKFRFLNTRFRKGEMEKDIGPLKVMSSTAELRDTFRGWAGKIYDAIGAPDGMREKGLKRIGKLVSYKWNVAEVAPNVFFETYILSNWGHAFGGGRVREAWGGYCYGMRDHFAVLYNGDVTLCCIDFDGKTAVGNLNGSTLRDVLSSDEVGRIMAGFRRLRLVHPYCRRCLGSGSFASWLVRPIADALVLKGLKPFFYKRSRLYE